MIKCEYCGAPVDATNHFDVATCGAAACEARYCEDAAGQYAAECAAENAWLRAAEAPTADDLAFDAWERERGVR